MLPVGKVAVVDLQGSAPSGVQSDPLPTPPASPAAAAPSFTPLTAQAASIAATAERSSLNAGAGQVLVRPFALDSSSRLDKSAPVTATLPNTLAPIPAATTVATEAEKSRPLLTARPSTATTAGVTSPRARSSDLKLNSRPQQAGSRSEPIGSGGGAAPSRTASASTAIAAAARANAAAANAIAESGALANSSFPVASGQLPGSKGFSGAVRTFTVPANTSLPQGTSETSAAAATGSQKHLQGAGGTGYAGASAYGPLLPGVFSASRSGPLAAGQANAMSASQTASVPMSQQQRLNGTAFMTAMQQSIPASSVQGTFHGTAASTVQAAADLPNNSHNQSDLGQQPAAHLGPGQNSRALPNPNFRLPCGPASFKASSNPSPRGPSLPGSLVNPSFGSASSALNPGASGTPAALGEHHLAPGLSSSSPSPVIIQSAGLHVTPSKPLSPSYRPQGLRAAALESGHQAISPAASQVTALQSFTQSVAPHSLAHPITQHSLNPSIHTCICPFIHSVFPFVHLPCHCMSSGLLRHRIPSSHYSLALDNTVYDDNFTFYVLGINGGPTDKIFVHVNSRNQT